MKNCTGQYPPYKRHKTLAGTEYFSQAADSAATRCFFVKKNRRGSTFFFLWAVFLLLAGFPAHAENIPVVILDPGHGGQNTGAALPDNQTESQISLKLAERINTILEGLGKTRVVLTRNGDYNLPLHERAGVAAHHRARVFISLHAGLNWGKEHSPKALVAYYESRTPATKRKDGENLPPKSLAARPWETVAGSQQAGSRRLAGVLQEVLGESLGRDRVRSGAYPFAVLAGVDAPAVLVELSGHESGRENQEALLNKIAQDIARAVLAFLEN